VRFSYFLFILLLLIPPSQTPLRAERLPVPNGDFEKGVDAAGHPLEFRFYRGTSEWILTPTSKDPENHAIAILERGLTGAIPIPDTGYYSVGIGASGSQPGQRAALRIVNGSTPTGWPPTAASFLSATHEVRIQTVGFVQGERSASLLSQAAEGWGPLDKAGSRVAKWFSNLRIDIFSGRGETVLIDNIDLVGNRLANPDLKEGTRGWEMTSGEWVGATDAHPARVVLKPGGILSQPIAAEPGGLVIFSCEAKTDIGTGSISLGIRYEDSAGKEVLQVASTEQVASNWGIHTVTGELPGHATRGEFEVRNTGESSLAVTGFSHGALILPYHDFSPNGDGAWDTLPLSVWIDPPRDFRLAISETATGREIKVKEVSQDERRSHHEWVWDGKNEENRRVPGGGYILSLDLIGEGSKTSSLKSDIVVNTFEPGPASIPPFDAPRFVRGFWMMVHDSYRVGEPPPCEEALFEEYNSLFQVARECHANCVLPSPLDHPVQPLIAASKKNGLDLIPSLYPPELLLRFSDPLSETELREVYRESTEHYAAAENVRGYYPLDEPPPFLFERAGMAAKILGSLDSERSMFFSAADLASLGELLDRVEPPAVSIHPYPFRVDSSTGELGDYVGQLEVGAREALKRDLPLWVVLPGFALPGQFRYPSGEEFGLCASLAIALGAKGLWTFVLNSAQVVEVTGLLGREGRPHPLLSVVSGIYARVESMEEFLRDCRMVEAGIRASSPGYIRSHADSNGQLYVFAVNREVASRRVIEIDLPAALGKVDSLRDRETGEVLQTVSSEGGGASVRVPILGGGLRILEVQGVARMDWAVPSLADETLTGLFTQLRRQAKDLAGPTGTFSFDWKWVGEIDRPELSDQP
jgi:hypothetical protein